MRYCYAFVVLSEDLPDGNPLRYREPIFSLNARCPTPTSHGDIIGYLVSTVMFDILRKETFRSEM